jgi:TolA-binding protein
MIKIRKNLTLAVVFNCILFCGLLVAAQEAKHSAKVYRTRQLGDKAFKDGLYILASKFYATYLREAAGDPNAQIDASECLIAAYVRSGNALQASEVFNKLTTTFAATISGNTNLRNRLSYWDGNIQMSGGNLKKAAETFTSLLNTLQQNTELYFQTMDALGTAQARSLHWDKTEKTYAMLEFAGKKSKWRELAIKKRLFALLMTGNFQRARAIIKTVPGKKNLYGKVIENLILIKENKLQQALDAYKAIRKHARGGDPLWYMLTSSLANAYQAKKDYKNALLMLNDSVIFANSEFDRQQALLSIINTAVAAENIKAAVTTAEKFLKSYPESFISNEIRLRLANLYAGEKKSEDALQVYETVIKDNNAAISLKMKSARSAAHIFILMKRYDDANDKFAFMAKDSKDKHIQGEGKYWMAELFYIQSKYKEAAIAFGVVADKFSDWKEQALFKQIKSLMNTKDYAQTIKKIQTFLKELSKSKFAPDISFLYALALKNDNKYSEAENQFAKFAKDYPDHLYAPRALFEEGTLALEKGNARDAVTAYTELCRRYPGNVLIPNTLYRRMYACFWGGDNKDAEDDAKALFAKYPKSIYTIHAGFRLADYYVDIKNYNEAVDILKKMFLRYRKDSKVAARAIYEIANTRFKEVNEKEALKALDELSEKFPKEYIADDGLFLRGDIHSGKSEYEKAIPFYKKAAANRPGSLLEIASWGRLGDSYLALGWKTPDGTNYLNAANYYNKILDQKDIMAQYRDQALYKLGRCEELLGDKGKALSKYHEAIYNYQLDENSDKMIAKSSIWFTKSALAAARLYLAKDTPEAAEAAIVLYKTLIRLGIEPIDDFKKKIIEISNKYKLKE